MRRVTGQDVRAPVQYCVVGLLGSGLQVDLGNRMMYLMWKVERPEKEDERLPGGNVYL